MTWQSQAGQDQFVHFLVGKDPLQSKSFLDIGANHPVTHNNTSALAALDWKGICIDLEDFDSLYPIHRPRCEFRRADAMTIDWSQLIKERPWLSTGPISYLSFDIDEATLPALQRFPISEIRCKVITIEHDCYRLGNEPKDGIRKILREAGYQLLCADVRVLWQGGWQPFEDWWIDPKLVNIERANWVRSQSANWVDIVRKLRMWPTHLA